MAFLKRRGARWYACFFIDSKKIVKATGIPVQSPDAPASRLKKLAYEIAESMERVAKGKTELSRAIDSLRSLSRDMGYTKERVLPMRDYILSHVHPDCKYIARSFLGFLEEKRIGRLEEITASDMTEFFLSLVGRLSAGSIKKYRVVISSVFNAAINDAIIIRNPVTRAKLPDACYDPPNERKAFTMEELALLCEKMPDPWPSVIRLTYLAGGLRMADVCTLRWDAVNFSANEITILPRKTRKTGKKLLIPMSPPLRSLLLDLPADSEYVFPSLAHDFATARYIPSATFVKWVKKLGIAQTAQSAARSFSQLSFHSIRHTVVTQLRAAGIVAPDVVRSIVGHSSEQVERGYFHAPAEKRMEGYSFLAQSLKTLPDM